jgi:DNA-binding NarL/FixJ family response regulator
MTKEKLTTGLKVVIVDDFHIIVDRIRKMLNDDSAVFIAGDSNNVTSAFFLIDSERPDVVIMDIHLEGEVMKGIALLNLLKKIYQGIRVIVFTNFAETRYRDLSMANGADYFFDKATDADQIGPALQEIYVQRIS